MPELTSVREVTIGGGVVLLIVLGLILRGTLVVREMYLKAIEVSVKKDEQIAALTATQSLLAKSNSDLAESYDRLSRRNKGRE